MATAAIVYQKEGYDTQGKRLMGRQAAGEGFLKAIARHSTADALYCYAQQKSTFEQFCQQMHPWMQGDRQIRWVPAGNSQALQEAGVLYRPDPMILDFAWQRRYSDQRAYSLCGITHTLASKETMKTLGDFLIAPVQPWDALICTSQAVKTMVEELLGNWADYLQQRIGARPQTQIQLPVIPLGVDCDAFEPNPKTRPQLRAALGIAADDIVVLFVGRLIFHAKAHPVPMYLAIEKAAKTTNAKIHLVQAGWFEDEQQESSFKQAANLLSPTVNHIFVDGRRPEIRSGIWSAADIFISLADNIQETFGLTPIEAMAARLPVIVSDWNGYKETVRHEVDGFRIPTLMPPAGCGLEFADSYGDDSLNYSTYVGHVSLMTSVDVDACAQALTILIAQPELRQRMGTNAGQRAREVYDWRTVIAAYEALWQELGERRAKAEPISSPIANPLCDDPCRVWSHYPTEILSAKLKLRLGSMATPDRLEIVRTLWMTNFGANMRAPSATIDQILAAIAQEGSLTVAEILSRYASQPIEQVYLCRTLAYLLKFDVLRSISQKIVE
jgi:glycosyltransferase involved in cell wall biosynthesis